MNPLDKHMLERLQSNSIYSKRNSGFIIGSSHARMVLHMPKQVLNPKIKEWNNKGIMDEKRGMLIINDHWGEIMGVRLNRR